MKKNSFKNWFGKKSPGETLLEVIVALLVITMGSATATSLIITAIQANVYNKDSLIALNLAQEGLEYMHNLRDSNWLAYSADTQHCWDMDPNNSSCAGPAYAGLLVGANPLNATNKGYALGTIISAPVTQKLDLTPGTVAANAPYLISYWDTDAAVNSDGVGSKTDDKDIMASAPVAGGTIGPATKYYRSIEIKYYTIGAAPTWTPMAPATNITANMMTVTSRVQWLDGGITREVSLSSVISAYK